MNEIKDKILEKIKAGEAKPKPKWYFIAKAGALALATIITALALLYFISFIFFIVDEDGVSAVYAFGWRGLWVLLISLPWLLILVCTVFVIVLEIFLRDYAFVYRKPVMYSVVSIAVLAAASGWAISCTHLQAGAANRAAQGRLPLAGRLYRGFGAQKFKYVHPGSIMSIANNSFQMQNRQNEILAVIITPETRFPLGVEFNLGDNVVVLGENIKGVITALGVRLHGQKVPNRLPYGPAHNLMFLIQPQPAR